MTYDDALSSGSASDIASAAGVPVAVVGMYSFRTPDPRRLAGFWSTLMGLPITEGATDDFVMLDFEHQVGPVTWMFERAEGVVGTGRLGLDIGSPDDDAGWAAVADHAEQLGATRLSQHEQDGVRWIVMTDPDGNQFRVFAPRPQL